MPGLVSAVLGSTAYLGTLRRGGTRREAQRDFTITFLCTLIALLVTIYRGRQEAAARDERTGDSGSRRAPNSELRHRKNAVKGGTTEALPAEASPTPGKKGQKKTASKTKASAGGAGKTKEE